MYMYSLYVNFSIMFFNCILLFKALWNCKWRDSVINSAFSLLCWSDDISLSLAICTNFVLQYVSMRLEQQQSCWMLALNKLPLLLLLKCELKSEILNCFLINQKLTVIFRQSPYLWGVILCWVTVNFTVTLQGDCASLLAGFLHVGKWIVGMLLIN